MAAKETRETLLHQMVNSCQGNSLQTWEWTLQPLSCGEDHHLATPERPQEPQQEIGDAREMPTPEKMAAEYGQVKGIPSRCSSNVIFSPTNLTLHCTVF